jgi:hypothetical protein
MPKPAWNARHLNGRFEAHARRRPLAEERERHGIGLGEIGAQQTELVRADADRVPGGAEGVRKQDERRVAIRPLGEPNRCLNPWSPVNCDGSQKGGEHTAGWYKQAFRRIAAIVRGGVSLEQINATLAEIGLPPLNRTKGPNPTSLPAAPVSIVWSPLPGGSPRVRGNFPGNYWPGSRWVDWASTDFYSQYPVWKDLNRFYRAHPALYEDDFTAAGFEWVDSGDRANSVLSYLRKGRGADDLLLVVCNCTPLPRSNYAVGVPRGGRWEECLNSDAPLYGGSGQGNMGGVDAAPLPWHGRFHSLRLTLPPLAVLVFKPAVGGGSGAAA